MTTQASPNLIPPLPGLGTTWYERGARYWARRVWTAVLFLLVLAFICYVALMLYLGVPRSDLPPTVRTVWDWTQAVASGVAVVWGWMKQRRDHRRKLLAPPTPQQMREAKRGESGRAPGLARAAVLPLLIAAPVLPAIVAWGVGWLVAMLTVREYPSEVGALLWLQGKTSRT
jgi:4-amino-4-deoxy-L-arabinose transferase-like glycosyltransferase